MLTCKNCNQEKEESAFSKHAACKSGYDTSRCKSCKKSKVDWSKVPLEKKIYNRIKSRATEKSLDFNLELSDIIIAETCPVLGQPFIYGDLDWTYSVDRKDPERGYVKGNILIISNRANRAKNNLTLDELQKVVKYVEGITNEAQF